MKTTYFDLNESDKNHIVIVSNSPLHECGDEGLRFTNNIIEEDYKQNGDRTVPGRKYTLNVELGHYEMAHKFNIDEDGHLNIELDEDERPEINGEGSNKVTVDIKRY